MKKPKLTPPFVPYDPTTTPEYARKIGNTVDRVYEPAGCWYCQTPLKDNQEFFCSVQHGYEWAVQNARVLQLVKIRK
jgi:hypothetical protein